MKRWLRPFVVLVGLAALVGVLVLVSGIVPIKASSGHWPITAWLLDFAKRRSVATHTLAVQVPDLEQPSLVLKGAGHYHLGCAPCHGSPALHHPVVAQYMTPAPPYLPPGIHQWEPEELFYIVKHGIKFTGMPAWPAENRDDEVWAVVAFLQRLPEMDEQEYNLLVQGDPPDVPETLIESCAGCHGETGRGRGADAFPVLAGQRPGYLVASLQAFANGERHSGIMKPIASGLNSQEIRQLASYYSEMDFMFAASIDEDPPAKAPQPTARGASGARGESIARGARIAHHGVAADRIPSCVDCHGPRSHRNPSERQFQPNPQYPILAGQSADYLVLQLELFQQRARGGSAYAHLMHPVADQLDAQQIQDVAHYYASLGESSDRQE